MEDNMKVIQQSVKDMSQAGSKTILLLMLYNSTEQ